MSRIIFQAPNCCKFSCLTEFYTTIPSGADLAVNGEIWAKKLRITQSVWADYVFDTAYNLMPLQKVHDFIRQHKHLPNIPSAKQVETEGLNVGDTQALLLQKIEELTLYIIQQNERIEKLEKELTRLKKVNK